MVERNLAKVEVASSNLVSRSISFFMLSPGIDSILITGDHGKRCEEGQWRQKSADKKRFGYQRSVVLG